MPKCPRSKLKLLYLRDILNEKTDENNCLNAAEIISALSAYGISAERKSIYDDIEQLKAYGMDILHTADGYCVGKRDFEIPEIKMLIDIVQSARFLTEKKSMNLIEKIEKLAPKNQAGKLRRSVVLSGRVKTPNERIYYNVDVIHDSINTHKQISFKYFTYGKNFSKQYKRSGEAYVVTPITLIWDDENYYLVAYDANANLLKHYRVDKMENVTILKEDALKNDVISGFDKARYSSACFDMYGGEECDVTLWISPEALGVFADRFGVKHILVKEEDGSCHATVRVAVSTHFYSWVFALGGIIRIMGPEKVKKGFVDHCEKMLESGIK